MTACCSAALWLVVGVTVTALAFLLVCAKGCKPLVVYQRGSTHCQRVLRACPTLQNRWVTPIRNLGFSAETLNYIVLAIRIDYSH